MLFHDIEQISKWNGISKLQNIVDFLAGVAVFETLGQLTEDQPLLIERAGLHSNLLLILRDKNRPKIAVMVLERNVSPLFEIVTSILSQKHAGKDVR